MRNAIVLFSGGLDSSVLTYMANKSAPDKLLAITFSYGQNNWKQEKECTSRLCRAWGINHKIIQLNEIRDCIESDLTTGKTIGGNSYVPNRNILFLTLAHAYAQVNGYNEIQIGTIAPYGLDTRTKEEFALVEAAGITRFNPAPDAVEGFVDDMQSFLEIFGGGKIAITAPLMLMDKADIFGKAAELGILNEALNSYSCFNSKHQTFKWGSGCGECNVCKERKLAYELYLKRTK